MVPSLASVWTDLNAIADALRLERGLPGHVPTASQQQPGCTPVQPAAQAVPRVLSPGWGGKGAVAESLRESLKRVVDNDRKCMAAAAARQDARAAVTTGIAIESLPASNTVCDEFHRLFLFVC
jgi:hypothetical protein